MTDLIFSRKAWLVLIQKHEMTEKKLAANRQQAETRPSCSRSEIGRGRNVKMKVDPGIYMKTKESKIGLSVHRSIEGPQIENRQSKIENDVVTG